MIESAIFVAVVFAVLWVAYLSIKFDDGGRRTKKWRSKPDG